MMKYLIIVIICLFTKVSFGQTDSASTSVEDTTDGPIFTFVEKMPEFPGGQGEMMQYLSKNVRYPQEELKKDISGKVYVQFTVNKKGKVKDAVVKRGVPNGPGLDAEALRIINAMPDWKPAMQNGKKVSFRYIIPINFQLR